MNATKAMQVRAARGILGWSRDQLVSASGVPKRTLVRFESEEAKPRAPTLAAIRAALEAAGVAFIAENGGGPGVRLLPRVGDWFINLPAKRMISSYAWVGLNYMENGDYAVAVPSPSKADIDPLSIARSARAALAEYLASHPGLKNRDM